jgi:hypothetical protein
LKQPSLVPYHANASEQILRQPRCGFFEAPSDTSISRSAPLCGKKSFWEGAVVV